MAATAGMDRARVLARARDPIAPDAFARFATQVRRRAGGEPLAYVLGRAQFLDLVLDVSPDVLIPRLETELLAEWGIAATRCRGIGVRVLDVGTGCGALALAIGRHAPEARVTATDCDPAALRVAWRNRDRERLARRVDLVCADLWPPVANRFHVVVANLPYVGTAERSDVEAGVLEWEPHAALFSGADGLAAIRRLVAGLGARLTPTGAAAFEIGWRQGDRAAELARRALPDASVEVRRDLAGRDRMVVIERSGPIERLGSAPSTGVQG